MSAMLCSIVHPRIPAAAVLAVLVFVGGAAAQTVEQRGLRPVDQTVEDVDPLGVSLRRHDAGLRTTGERGNVFRYIDPREPTDGSADPNAQRLFYMSRGVTAEFDRSQYGILIDQRNRSATVLQLIPPNTVFHIGPPPARPPRDAGPAPLGDGQIDGRVTEAPTDHHATAGDSSRRDVSHDELAIGQRAVVLAALHRMARPQTTTDDDQAEAVRP